MITTQSMGTTQNIKVAEFGHGTIKIARAREQEDDRESMILLYNQEKRTVGDISEAERGKYSDEIGDAEIALKFKSIEGLTALIHSLVELQGSMLGMYAPAETSTVITIPKKKRCNCGDNEICSECE